MNIHFKDKNLFDNMMESALFKIKMGSHLYGLNNENSDSDILIIYANGSVNNESHYRTYHQLQFKTEDTDFIFVNLQQFIYNVLSGDSTINFEVLHTEELKNDKYLNFLNEYKHFFYNQNIIKSYLGLAKRDYKNLRKLGQYSGKKASHFVRGVLMADCILNNKDINLNVYQGENFSLLKYLKEETTEYNSEIISLLQKYEILMEDLRKQLDNELNQNKVIRNIKGEDSFLLNKKIFELVKTDFYKSKQKDFLDFGSLFDLGTFEEQFNY